MSSVCAFVLTRNRKALLGECVRALLAQTHPSTGDRARQRLDDGTRGAPARRGAARRPARALRAARGNTGRGRRLPRRAGAPRDRGPGGTGCGSWTTTPSRAPNALGDAPSPPPPQDDAASCSAVVHPGRGSTTSSTAAGWGAHHHRSRPRVYEPGAGAMGGRVRVVRGPAAAHTVAARCGRPADRPRFFNRLRRRRVLAALREHGHIRLVPESEILHKVPDRRRRRDDAAARVLLTAASPDLRPGPVAGVLAGPL
jgi:hypothetical protein